MRESPHHQAAVAVFSIKLQAIVANLWWGNFILHGRASGFYTKMNRRTDTITVVKMSKSQERGGTFVPKPDLLRQIMEMGFSKNAAIKGLYHTRNGRADAAISWIFDNNTRKDLDDPLEIHVVDTAGSDEEDNGMAAFLQASDFYKMVLVVNCELKMGTGKTAAQVGHAAIGLYKNLVSNPKKYGPILHQWEEFGESKIVLKGRHTQQLLDLCSKATSLNLPTYLVEDAGKTEVEQGVITVLSIMGKGNIVDMVTEELSLL